MRWCVVWERPQTKHTACHPSRFGIYAADGERAPTVHTPPGKILNIPPTHINHNPL